MKIIEKISVSIFSGTFYDCSVQLADHSGRAV
jgi:hypothetical protein